MEEFLQFNVKEPSNSKFQSESLHSTPISFRVTLFVSKMFSVFILKPEDSFIAFYYISL